MRFSVQAPKIAWMEGTVNRKADHVSLSYGERRQAMALVAPNRNGFTVEFVYKASGTAAHATRMLDEVRHELDFYLLEVVGPDSWAFVQYHCDTPANHLSRVHWTWHPKPASPQPVLKRAKV